MQDFELTNTAILNSLEELFPATKGVIRKDYPPTLEDDAPEYGDRHSFDTVKITNFSNEMLKQKPEMTYASGSKVSVAKGEQYYLLSEDGLEKVKENYSERHHDLRDGRSSGSGETLLEACHRTETIPEYVLEIKRGIHGRHNTHGRNLFVHRVHDMHRDEIERSLDAMEEAAEEALT